METFEETLVIAISTLRGWAVLFSVSPFVPTPSIVVGGELVFFYCIPPALRVKAPTKVDKNRAHCEHGFVTRSVAHVVMSVEDGPLRLNSSTGTKLDGYLGSVDDVASANEVGRGATIAQSVTPRLFP